MLCLKDEKGEEAWLVNMPVYIIIYLYINLRVGRTLSVAVKLLAVSACIILYVRNGRPTISRYKTGKGCKDLSKGQPFMCVNDCMSVRARLPAHYYCPVATTNDGSEFERNDII